MPDAERQKDAMDVLQAWVDDYNGRARPTIRLGSAGEAGGAQLRLKYSPAEGHIAILHLVAVNRDGRAAILVRRFEGPAAEAAGEAGGWGRPPAPPPPSPFPSARPPAAPRGPATRGTGWGPPVG